MIADTPAAPQHQYITFCACSIERNKQTIPPNIPSQVITQKREQKKPGLYGFLLQSIKYTFFCNLMTKKPPMEFHRRFCNAFIQ